MDTARTRQKADIIYDLPCTQFVIPDIHRRAKTVIGSTGFHPLIFSAPVFIILFAPSLSRSLFFFIIISLAVPVRFHFSGLKGVLLPNPPFAPPAYPYLSPFSLSLLLWGAGGIIFQLGWRLQIGKAALALSRWAPDSTLINCTLSKKWWLAQDNRQDR